MMDLAYGSMPDAYRNGNGTMGVIDCSRIAGGINPSSCYSTPSYTSERAHMPIFSIDTPIELLKTESIQIASNRVILACNTLQANILLTLSETGYWMYDGSITSRSAHLHVGFITNGYQTITRIIISASCENFDPSYCDSIVHTGSIPITINTYID